MSGLEFRKGFPEGFTPQYPMTRPQIREIEKLTMEQGGKNGLVSLRVGKSHGTSCPGILRSDEGIRVALDEILKVRQMVIDGNYPFEYMETYWPDDFGPMPTNFPEALANAHDVGNGLSFVDPNNPLSFDNPQGCAKIVRMDHPGDLHRLMFPWMLEQGFVFRGAERDSFDFVDIAGEDDKLATAAREIALEKAFDIKWYRGIARPEEYTGDMSMSAYPEGCPGHCESYAGHAAFSESTARHFCIQWRVIGKQGKLEPLPNEAIKQIVWHAYCFAQWRAFALMHYAVSNVEPFGEAHEYGYDRYS